MAGPLPAIVFWREGSASGYPRSYERLIGAGCAGGLCVPSVAALFLFVSDSTQRSVAGRPPALAGASSVVIFDCNGVLVDSEPLVAEVVSREFMRAGFALTPEIVARYFTGRRPADMFADVEIAAGRRLPPNFATVLTNEILKRFRADLRVTAHAAHALLHAMFDSHHDFSGPALKQALENPTSVYRGVVTTYDHSFSATDHDAISANMLWLGTWRNQERAYYYKEDERNATLIRRKQQAAATGAPAVAAK